MLQERRARRKQDAKAARNVAQEVLCAAPGRLGKVELTRRGTSGVGAGQSEGETSDGSQPYVPEWPRVTKGSNLALSEARLEWLRNCLPPSVMEGYKDLGASSTVGLGVQPALLGVISAVQAYQVMVKQARQIRDRKHMCNNAEETAETRKVQQQEIANEVTALTEDLTQAREQMASQEFVLSEKDMELAAKNSELTSWAAEAAQIQQEIEWEGEGKNKAQAEAAEAAKKLVEVEKVAAEAQAKAVEKVKKLAEVEKVSVWNVDKQQIKEQEPTVFWRAYLWSEYFGS